MAKPRKHYSSEEKVSYGDACLKRGGFHPMRRAEPQADPLLRWQKEFFENGVAAFGPRRPSGQAGEQHRIAALEQKLQRMNHVLAVLMEEYVALKEHAAEVRT